MVVEEEVVVNVAVVVAEVRFGMVLLGGG